MIIVIYWLGKLYGPNPVLPKAGIMCPPHLQRHAPLVCTKLWAAWLSRAEDGRSAQREEGPDVEVHNRSVQAYGPSEEDSGRVRCYRPGDEAIGVPVTVKSLRGLGISVLRDGPACAPQIFQLACSGCRHGYWSVVTWRVHTQNLLAIFFREIMPFLCPNYSGEWKIRIYPDCWLGKWEHTIILRKHRSFSTSWKHQN